MKMKNINLTIKTLAAAAVLVASAQQVFADGNRLCAYGEYSNCFLTGNFPPDLAANLGVTGDDAETIRFVDGEWYMGGHHILSFGTLGWTPVVGDWNGDGYDTPGLYVNGFWMFKGSWDAAVPNDTSTAIFGMQKTSPVVGDWNSDGIDSIGYYKAGKFELRPLLYQVGNEITIEFSGVSNMILTGANAPQPIVGKFKGNTDWVGMTVDGTSKFVSANTSGTYDFNSSDPALQVGNYYPHTNNLYPITWNNQLIFAWKPDAGDTSVCPLFDTITCAWLLLNDDRPNSGFDPEIPDPPVFD